MHAAQDAQPTGRRRWRLWESRGDDQGQELYISETTVKTRVTHILQKLDLRDRVQAVVLAYQAGLFEAP